jgi:hypothetical protein
MDVCDPLMCLSLISALRRFYVLGGCRPRTATAGRLDGEGNILTISSPAGAKPHLPHVCSCLGHRPGHQRTGAACWSSRPAEPSRTAVGTVGVSETRPGACGPSRQGGACWGDRSPADGGDHADAPVGHCRVHCGHSARPAWTPLGHWGSEPDAAGVRRPDRSRRPLAAPTTGLEALSGCPTASDGTAQRPQRLTAVDRWRPSRTLTYGTSGHGRRGSGRATEAEFGEQVDSGEYLNAAVASPRS